MTVNTLSQHHCFGGVQGVYSHFADSTNCEMRFSVFIPPQAEHGPVPVLTFLSGLTCTEENFTVKAGAQRFAAEHGLMIVAPDTSPRGDDVADDEAYDLGQGAGFYVDARMSPWAAHYLMYSYITQELPQVILENFPANNERQGLFGHSMGGHGALVCALRNPYQYHSVSAFAPIVAPSGCPWGVKAFTAYFGDDRERWRRHDACELIRSGHQQSEILVDQGTADSFLEEELKPELLRDACAAADQPLILRMQEGYDHSYYFIASFMADHIAHHALILKA
jgi:S-formylglutathione hydrolase